MLQTLFYIPQTIYGIPVFGFGLLLALWLVVCAVFLAWLVRRQGFNADTWGYVPLLAVVAVVIWWLLPVLCEPEGLPIRGYGMMILAAVVAGMGLAVRRARRAGVDPEMIFSLAFWMIVPGIVGARALHVAEYWQKQYWPAYGEGGGGWPGLLNLLGTVVNIPKGGLVVYGAFLGGVAGFLLFSRKHRIPLLATADLIAPSLVLGLCLGRIGCLLNGCCFGGHCEARWAVTFPWGSPVHEQEVMEGRAPVHGLKLAPGDPLPVIAEVEPGSPAEQHGLRAGQQVVEINGETVKKLPKDEPSDDDGRQAWMREAVQKARWTLFNAQKLRLEIAVNHRGESIPWLIADPPESPGNGSPARLTIYGFEIAGGEHDPPLISRVVPRSPEQRAGLRPQQRIVKVNGRPVRTIGELRALLQAHRAAPWVEIGVRKAGDTPALRFVEFPLAQPLPRSDRVHPTQLYDALNALLVCLVLLAADRFCRRDGQVTALLLTLYPVGRFLIEMLRTDEPNIWGTGLHISQNISLVVLVCAAALWFYVQRQPPGRAGGAVHSPSGRG